MPPSGTLRILVIGDYDDTDLENAIDLLMEKAHIDGATCSYIGMAEFMAITRCFEQIHARPTTFSANDASDTPEGNHEVFQALNELMRADLRTMLMQLKDWTEPELMYDAVIYTDRAHDYVGSGSTDEDGFTRFDLVPMIIKALSIEDNFVETID